MAPQQSDRRCVARQRNKGLLQTIQPAVQRICHSDQLLLLTPKDVVPHVSANKDGK